LLSWSSQRSCPFSWAIIFGVRAGHLQVRVASERSAPWRGRSKGFSVYWKAMGAPPKVNQLILEIPDITQRILYHRVDVDWLYRGEITRKSTIAASNRVVYVVFCHLATFHLSFRKKWNVLFQYEIIWNPMWFVFLLLLLEQKNSSTNFCWVFLCHPDPGPSKYFCINCFNNILFQVPLVFRRGRNPSTAVRKVSEKKAFSWRN